MAAGLGLASSRKVEDHHSLLEMAQIIPRVPSPNLPQPKEERRPLAVGKGGGAGFDPLSRWERVGVRAGGGGGRATLLNPAAELRKALPQGENHQPLPWRPLHNRPRASMGGSGRSCLFSRREKIEMRGHLANRRGLSKSATLAGSHPIRKALRRARTINLSRWRPLHNRPRASMGGAGEVLPLLPTGED